MNQIFKCLKHQAVNVAFVLDKGPKRLIVCDNPFVDQLIDDSTHRRSPDGWRRRPQHGGALTCTWAGRSRPWRCTASSRGRVSRRLGRPGPPGPWHWGGRSQSDCWPLAPRRSSSSLGCWPVGQTLRSTPRCAAGPSRSAPGWRGERQLRSYLGTYETEQSWCFKYPLHQHKTFWGGKRTFDIASFIWWWWYSDSTHLIKVELVFIVAQIVHNEY